MHEIILVVTIDGGNEWNPENKLYYLKRWTTNKPIILWSIKIYGGSSEVWMIVNSYTLDVQPHTNYFQPDSVIYE